MKKVVLPMLLLAAVVAGLLLSNPLRVMAQDPAGIVQPTPTPILVPVTKPRNVPAMGSWTWDDASVTGSTIPQYQLAPTNDDDYATLQSEGIHLSGGAQLCHPYPGGQFGWNAEIRVLTHTGWQSVPTTNAWVPDEEGKFMTCANVWYGGTYAVFGYWEKPEGWVDRSCADLPVLSDGLNWENYSSAAQFNWATPPDVPYVILSAYPGGIPGLPGLIPSSMFAGTTGDRCSAAFPGAIETDSLFYNGSAWGSSGPAIFLGYYCACDAMYRVDQPFPPQAAFD